VEASQVYVKPGAIEALRELEHLPFSAAGQKLGEEQGDGETGRQSHAHLHLSKRGAINFAQKRRKVSNEADG
jgi:hypothetical protein